MHFILYNNLLLKIKKKLFFNRFRKATSDLDRFRHTTTGIVNAQRFAPKVNLKIHLATEPGHNQDSGKARFL